LQAFLGTGATGLEPATSGVTGGSKPFRLVSPSRANGQIKRFSAGSIDCLFRLVSPSRFQDVSRVTLEASRAESIGELDEFTP
jgi:hypothetical protein